MLLLAAAAMSAAGPPLPSLMVEPADQGSVLYVRNVASITVTAYLIELVDYPGSYYALWQDEIGGTPIVPGGDFTMRVNNMLIGAVPGQTRVQAAVYADGSFGGIREKAQQLVDRRRAVMATVREAITRLEKAKADNAAKDAMLAALTQWVESLQPAPKADRTSQAVVHQLASAGLIGQVIAKLKDGSPDDALAFLRAQEIALAASKPPL
jgi:hypothetical protein